MGTKIYEVNKNLLRNIKHNKIYNKHFILGSEDPKVKDANFP